MSAVLMLSSCIPEVPTAPANTAKPDNPLVGDWEMTRERIEPSVPVPDLALNMVSSDSPTWSIADTSQGLVITFNGNETWFTTPMFGLDGVSIDKKPTIVEVGESSSSLTFKSGGSVYVDKVMSIPGVDLKVEKISVNYEDTVSVVSSSRDTMSATISVSLSGKYFAEEAESGLLEERRIDPRSATITYSGKRK
jgi:hypothetical protein